jgi:signal transduction histidine kinase
VARLRLAGPGAQGRAVPGFEFLAATLRGTALVVALALAAAQGDATLGVWVSGGVLAAVVLVRAARPFAPRRVGPLAVGSMLVEVGIAVAAVQFTGLAHSPFLFFLAVSTLLVGHQGGLRIVPGLVAIACLGVIVPTFVVAQDRVYATDGVQFATLLFLVGLVGGYSRYLLDDAGRVGAGLVHQMQELSELNSLLLDLHAASERVPMPLELSGATAWVVDRLDDAFSPDVAAVILRDPLSQLWRFAAARGLRPGAVGSTVELPPILEGALRQTEPVSLGFKDQGLDYASTWGMYAALRARGEVIGLAAVECRDRRAGGPAERRRLAGIASAAALAVDNARWLERIHTFGIEQERSRLARDLHDHVGQSMVYLGLELDRLVKVNHGRAVAEDLATLRRDVRALLTELRDTLVDLRTDVSPERDLASVLQSLADRLNRRGRVCVRCAFEVERRLPLLVEREVWRIAQEAVVNAERHARATKVDVMWFCHRRWALLEVSDDGIGMPGGVPPRKDSYGLVGMRERADAIGARLELRSDRGKGTTVTLRLRVD